MANSNDYVNNELEPEDDSVENGAVESDVLFKVDELRPLPFSKTVTLFDVYETDEENFEPYISPLATVGTVSSSSSSETQTSDEDQATEQEQTEENSGLLGMGTGLI